MLHCKGVKMTVKIRYGEHEYHLENLNTDDIEVYLDGMFIAGYSNLCSAIGHCVEKQNFDKDLQYITRNRT